VGLLLLGSGGTGFVASQVDGVIPLVFGRRWKRADRWKRFAVLLVILLLPVAVLGFLLPPGFENQFGLPEGLEWITAALALGVAYYLGISFGSLLLMDARDVIRMIVEAMFPRGGAIFYGAQDVDAADRVLSFLDRI